MRNSSSTDKENYLNTNQCGALIGRSAGAVRNLVLRRVIPFRKPAGRLVFIEREIRRWVEGSEGLTIEELHHDK